MIFSPERQNVNSVTWPHKKAAGRMALQNPDFLVTQVDIKISQYRKWEKKKMYRFLISLQDRGVGKFGVHTFDPSFPKPQIAIR